MKVAIMQPYFLPYLGYFQLIAAVDVFIVYDNIKYVKGGWINRNRICRDGAAVTVSVPLKRASDRLDVRDRELAAEFDRGKLLSQIRGAYLRAPHYAQTAALLERIVRHEDDNLFGYLNHSLRTVCEFLGLRTRFLVSSEIPIDHSLKRQHKVLALCREVGASTYVNAIGGVDLYSPEEFGRCGLDLRFIRMRPCEYPQFGHAFVPLLSIIDVLMFNPLEAVREWIAGRWELI